MSSSLLAWPGINGACEIIRLRVQKQLRLLDEDASLEDYRVPLVCERGRLR